MSWKKIDAEERSARAAKLDHGTPYVLEGSTSPAEIAELRATFERVHLRQAGPTQARARRMLQILDWLEEEKGRRAVLGEALRKLGEAIDDHPRAHPALLVELKAVRTTLETLCERDG